jgi:glycosyltransferase involved in cell wall biosynthesis
MIKRDQYKCINSSSPDRSWPILLEIWPEIRKQVPQATLTLAYGFHNWEFSAQHDQLQKDLIRRLKIRIQELEPLGVRYIGRVSQSQLAEEFLSSSCWVHPTWFTETSCITAMEAQAAGLYMITSSIAALNETAGSRAILIPGEWTSKEYQKLFIEATVRILQNVQDKDRLELQKYAKQNFCMDKLSYEWVNMFSSLIENKKTNPIVPYQPTAKYRKL